MKRYFPRSLQLLPFLVLTAFAASCTHPIFCNQQILSSVAMSKQFADSKTFVDLHLKVPVESALFQFKEQGGILAFLKNCFDDGTQILQPADLPDFQSEPANLLKIVNPELRRFALDIQSRWPTLAKKVNLTLNYPENKCKDYTTCTSILPQLHNETIIMPGGRFMESYYWDSYWIVKGLIVSGMIQTAHKSILLFAKVIEKYGFIPNGFRQYYLNRSQPPFLFLMAKEVIQALFLQGKKAEAEALELYIYSILIKQHNFWMDTHSLNLTIDSQTFTLNVYNANTTTPRPQSYRQDSQLIQNIKSETERKRIMKGVSSMAESGWDFSSRWLTDSQDLKSTIINSIVPSDLNTLMGLMEGYLATLSSKYGKPEDIKKYFGMLESRKKYFKLIINDGRYPDYVIANQEKEIEIGERSIYPSDYYPFLLFNDDAQLPSLFKNIVNPVSSSIKTGQQWDLPNVWAPNSWILHQTVSFSNAFNIAQQWVSTVYCGWLKTGNIYQKYRWDKLGERGEGGQYKVQTGFGWTNGLVLYYLNLYKESLKAPACP